MVVISFFKDLLMNISAVINFVITPLGELNSDIVLEPFASMSIISLFSVGVGALLVTLLVIHLIQLVNPL